MSDEPGQPVLRTPGKLRSRLERAREALKQAEASRSQKAGKRSVEPDRDLEQDIER